VWLHVWPNAVSLDVQLLPYLYSAFHEAHRTGVPVARPLFFAAPADPQARKAEGQWLLGDAVLVSPVLKQGATEVRCGTEPFIRPRNAKFQQLIRCSAHTCSSIPDKCRHDAHCAGASTLSSR
jgi:hypothetical protein